MYENYPGFGTVQENYSKHRAQVMTKLYNQQQKNTLCVRNKQNKKSPRATIVNIQVDQIDQSYMEQTERQPSSRRQHYTPLSSDLPDEFSTMGSVVIKSPKMGKQTYHPKPQNKPSPRSFSKSPVQKGTNTSAENPYSFDSKEQLINIQVENKIKHGTIKYPKSKS